jgi:MotA/TolQ/ExbB proton channel family
MLPDQSEVQELSRTDPRLEFWRLRIYSAGFLVAFAFHLALNGVERWPALLAISVLAIGVGLWRGKGPWLSAGVMLAILHALAFPILQQSVINGESVAATVARVSVWPQLLVTLIGSRVLATEGRLSFAQFWRAPTKWRATVELQSIPSAIALGSFLTLVFYLLVPHALTFSEKRTSEIIVSAMLGGTIVHSAIIFLFFVILSSIVDSVHLYAVDRSVLAGFSRRVEEIRTEGTKPKLAAILTSEFASAVHTRTFRLLTTAFETKKAGSENSARLAAHSFDGFQVASRQFVRALLPVLPLLGFLGTVVGLAAAISELPRGLTEGTEHAFDISASLAGLAVKFETTRLGLMASMISSLSLNYLEKREAELAAACLLIVMDAGEPDV